MGADATARFFEELADRRHEPSVGNASGSARFDIVDGNRTQRWLVTFTKGNISVSRKNAHAGTVVKTSRENFERAVAGKLNLMAAALRGELSLSGDPRLLARLQRLFPRPDDGTDARS